MRRIAAILTLLSVAGIASAQESDPWADEDWGDPAWEEESAAIVLTGFAELAAGMRIDEDSAASRRMTLGDARLRAEAEWLGEKLELNGSADLWYDDVSREVEEEVRELTGAFSPADRIDVVLGRQVLTWGTGDLLFLNDLFPKDFVSFFAGRDDEYLKAPSNTIRVGFYGAPANLEIAWTPRFQPDEYLTGERFSFFSPAAGRVVSPEPPLGARQPRDDELALRLYRTVRGVEYAAYGYRGYFKQPTAVDALGRPTFAALTSLGASIRLPILSGLFNAELALYESRGDKDGDEPAIPNGQIRFLAGFERELVTSLTMGLQYYLEHTRDYDALIANSPAPAFEPDEWRQVLTNRLTFRTDQDRWTLSLFTFYSPTDSDFYVRPTASFRQSDAWMFTTGANWFGGSDDYTFFGQLEDNSNLYLRMRYSY